MRGEFDLIGRYFQDIGLDTVPAAGRDKMLTPVADRASIIVGNGDDAAVIQPPIGQQLVVCTDTLVAGRHFPLDTCAADIGWKAIAVNLSDLAAMGATAHSVLLALAVPAHLAADDGWLLGLRQGLQAICRQYPVSLIGGDTTRSELLTLTVTALGWLPAGTAIRRGGARPGDLVYVSGTLGDAAYALQHYDQLPADSFPRQRLDRPEPRLALGQALRGHASATLDVSDGLWQDLGHIAQHSQVNISLNAAQLPLSATLQALPADVAWMLALTGGDDYELAFCVPAAQADVLSVLAQQLAIPLTCIGQVTPLMSGLSPQVQVLDHQGQPLTAQRQGFQHF